MSKPLIRLAIASLVWAVVVACAGSERLEPIAWCDGYDARIDAAIAHVPVGTARGPFRDAILAALPAPEAAALADARRRVASATRADRGGLALDQFAHKAVVEAFDDRVATCAADARGLQAYVMADRISMHVRSSGGDPESLFSSSMRDYPGDGDSNVAVLVSLVAD